MSPENAEIAAPVNPAAPRSRTSHNKVRTGCRTCKARRVKCDEKKPVCHRCLSTGRKCEGYVVPAALNWAVVQTSAPTQRVVLTAPIFDDRGVSGSCFDYFRTVAAAELSRYYGGDFWNRSLLQASHEFPAVRHAIAAAGALHRRYKEGTEVVHRGAVSCDTSTPIVDQFARKQYSQALKQLIRDISGRDGARSRLESLICGVLFTLIEVLQGCDIAALTHLDSVVKLVNEAETAPASQGQVAIVSDMEDELSALIERLDLEASIAAVPRPPQLRLPAIDDACLTVDPSHSEEQIVEELTRDLNLVMRHVWGFMRSESDGYRYTAKVNQIPSELVEQQQKLLARLASWSEHYEALPRSDSPSKQLLKKHALLQVHYHISFLILQGVVVPKESVYDAHLERFREVVRLSAILNAGATKNNQTSFASDVGIVFPLFWTARKCRDGDVRRQALALLKACPREGIWYPELHAAIVQRAMEIEEYEFYEQAGHERQPRAEDILEHWRVHGIGMNLHKPSRTAQVVFHRLPDGVDGLWINVVENLSY